MSSRETRANSPIDHPGLSLWRGSSSDYQDPFVERWAPKKLYKKISWYDLSPKSTVGLGLFLGRPIRRRIN